MAKRKLAKKARSKAKSVKSRITKAVKWGKLVRDSGAQPQ